MPAAVITTLLSAILAQTPGPQRPRDVIDVYRCDFEKSSDINFDRWPDEWTRLRDREHPAFLSIAIKREAAAIGERCLHIQLDGGSATVYSPKIAVNPNFNYILGGFVRTDGLRNDVAYCHIVFYDAEHRQILTHRITPLQEKRWEPFISDEIAISGHTADYAIIELHLEPQSGMQPDLHGSAWFDDIWLGRLPRMSIEFNHPNHLFHNLDDVIVACNVSGVPEEKPLIEFELINAFGERIAADKKHLDGQPVRIKGPTLADTAEGNHHSHADVVYAGIATWRPPVPDYGFYRIRVTMSGTKGVIHQGVASLAVLSPLPATEPHGEFGWTLPKGDRTISMEELVVLVAQAGVNWVKFPVWYSEQELTRPDEITWFAERLKKNGSQLVGLLDQPPRQIRHLFGETDELQAAEVFADEDLWKKHLHSVITRLSLKIRWWQLGADDDVSFVEYPRLPDKIDSVRQQLERFGQESFLGIGWKWIHQPPRVADPPWKFLTLSSHPSLTSTELQTYLAGMSDSPAKRWVVMDPLDRVTYDLETRACDLVNRMVSAKVCSADGIFLSDPFDSHQGILNEDATPDDLFVPWRTTAQLLSGAEYLGELQLPGQTRNRVFKKGDQAMMVLWNETPTTETLFLGTNVSLVNLWGQQTHPQQDGHRQVIPIGPQPIFVTGVNLPVVQWRLDFSLDCENLASVFNRPQSALCRIVNRFPQGVTGRMSLQAPDGWDTNRTHVNFKLAEHADLEESFEIKLQPVAQSGRHQLRVAFKISADQLYEFSVYRHLELGLGDVSIDVTTNIDEDGNLIVTQQMQNHNDQAVSFDCMLFAPDRRRQRRHVLNLRRLRNSQTYVILNGEELLGETLWLRAEEIGGERMLNHQIVVGR